MTSFIDEHRGDYGVEPICKALPPCGLIIPRIINFPSCPTDLSRTRSQTPGSVSAIGASAAGSVAEVGIDPLVGSVGDSYDNALAKTINGLYKAEVIHRRGPWRPFKAVEYAMLEWVDWFNNRRSLEPIGNIPPAKAEVRHYALLDELPMAA